MRHGQSGFSLAELIVAMALTSIVALLASTLAVEALYGWRSDSARIDLQQRARVAADVLTRALLESGAGPDDGPSRGPLVRAVPPLLPRRVGRRDPDPPGSARTDAITILRAVPEAEPAVLLLAAAAGTTTLEVAAAISCGLPACGLSEGLSVLVSDAAGNFDLFSVLAATGSLLTVRHHGAGSGVTYPPGSPVVAVDVATFYLDAAARTLNRYDGDASDLPVVDNVVELRVQYYADGRAPMWPRPPAGVGNCLYESDGTYRAALLPVLGPADGPHVLLAADALTDGPWCGIAGNQYDADLLRIRRVRISVRLQAEDPAARGRDPVAFRNPGTGMKTPLLVPDRTVVVEARPRNLRAGW
jgi:prepilin-type N-terminal cleavage/methylation domain-containing protein